MQGPKIVRPPEIWSSVDHSMPSTSGLRIVLTRQAVPSLTRLVRCEIAESSEIDS